MQVTLIYVLLIYVTMILPILVMLGDGVELLSINCITHYWLSVAFVTFTNALFVNVSLFYPCLYGCSIYLTSTHCLYRYKNDHNT